MNKRKKSTKGWKRKRNTRKIEKKNNDEINWTTIEKRDL